MREGVLKVLGTILLTLGIMGILLFGTNTVGNVISNKNLETLTFKNLEDITIKENQKDSIEIYAENKLQKDLTNCKLFFFGQNSNWLSNEEIKNIQSNSEEKFILKISTPENAIIGEYPIELTLSCNEESISDNFNILITKGVDAIKIREMKLDNGLLNIIYTFNNEGFIGEETYVEIWVKNPDGFEINRIKDSFSINTDQLIVRDINLDLKEEPHGVYDVFFSHPSDSKDYIKKSVILGNSRTSGNAIFNVSKGKGLPYLAFLIFIGIGIFFILRAHRKTVQEVNEPISTKTRR